jgi:hypothetical protein
MRNFSCFVIFVSSRGRFFGTCLKNITFLILIPFILQPFKNKSIFVHYITLILYRSSLTSTSIMNTDYCMCEILIAGLKPQLMQCLSCKGFMHRKCFHNGLSTTDYVLMKKNNEPFQFNCMKCGIPSFRTLPFRPHTFSALFNHFGPGPKMSKTGSEMAY